MRDLFALPKNAAIRKINELVKRARAAKVHALLISHLKAQMPSMFWKQSKQQELLDKMEDQFWQVQRQYNLAIGDFPDLTRFKAKYAAYDFSTFKKLDMALIQRMDDVLAHDLPDLMQDFPTDLDDAPFALNPKRLQQKTEDDKWDWEVTPEQVHKFIEYFKTLSPVDGVADRAKAEEILRKSGLPFKTLGKIWELADVDQDGELDADEFCVAMHLTNQACQSIPLPDTLPVSLVPPHKRKPVAVAAPSIDHTFGMTNDV
eukprot:comp21514_c0_seq2/m.29863 comp21514_c0_seq2/g.29863  ORF comp21514_c0_seq2/g.29863 comp21514_c0_seq2/m.29863 type:complete len:260 (-) comp21514_c0_seq2:971-1750(-)